MRTFTIFSVKFPIRFPWYPEALNAHPASRILTVSAKSTLCALLLLKTRSFDHEFYIREYCVKNSSFLLLYGGLVLRLRFLILFGAFQHNFNIFLYISPFVVSIISD